MQAAFAAARLNGIEEALRRVPGVLRVQVIRTDPAAQPPDTVRLSDRVPSPRAIVRMDFDPALVNYERLLAVFWESHDPTAGDVPSGAGATQSALPSYSAVYYYDDDQRIRASMAKIQFERSGRLGRPLATHILPAPETLMKSRRGGTLADPRRTPDSASSPERGVNPSQGDEGNSPSTPPLD